MLPSDWITNKRLTCRNWVEAFTHVWTAQTPPKSPHLGGVALYCTRICRQKTTFARCTVKNLASFSALLALALARFFSKKRVGVGPKRVRARAVGCGMRFYRMDFFMKKV